MKIHFNFTGVLLGLGIDLGLILLYAIISLFTFPGYCYGLLSGVNECNYFTWLHNIGNPLLGPAAIVVLATPIILIISGFIYSPERKLD